MDIQDALDAAYHNGYDKGVSVTALKVIAEVEKGVLSALETLNSERNPVIRRTKYETYTSLIRFLRYLENKYSEVE